MKMNEYTNRQLIEALENACYKMVHSPCKTNSANLDRIEREVLRRLEAHQ